MWIVFMFPHTADWADAVIKARKKRFPASTRDKRAVGEGEEVEQLKG